MCRPSRSPTSVETLSSTPDRDEPGRGILPPEDREAEERSDGLSDGAPERDLSRKREKTGTSSPRTKVSQRRNAATSTVLAKTNAHRLSR